MKPATSAHAQLDQQLKKINRLSVLLDSQFKIPGTKIKFGLDSLIGLVPVVGDTVSMSLSFYFIHVAMKHKVKKRTIGKMMSNIFKDYCIGLIPIVGDYLDIASKANLKNAKILTQALENQYMEHQQNPKSKTAKSSAV